MKIAFVNRRAGLAAPRTGPVTYMEVLEDCAARHGTRVDRLRELPRTGGYDAVHVLDMKQLVAQKGRASLTACPYPVVLDMHDDYWTGAVRYPAVDSALRSWRRKQRAPRYRSLLNQAAHVVVHSATAAPAVPHDRVTVLPLPVAPGTPAAVPEGNFTVLFVGRDGARKGLPVLGEALRRLVRRGLPCRLHLAGEDFVHLRWMRARWLRGLDVVDHGAVAAGDLERLWDQSHLTVLPSYDETFGLAPLESLLRGVPVVVTDTGGLGPWVRACNGGPTVPVGDASALAEALATVRSDYAAWRENAARARERLIPVHDPDTVWGQCLNVYANLR